MSRKLPVRILAVAAIGFAFGGVAAALTDGGSEPKDDSAPKVTEISEPESSTDAQGPDATGEAKFGLCTAYSSGQGGENGKKNDSTAFDALEEAAGVAPEATDEEREAAVTAFCADVLAEKGANGGEGQGQGEGGPPEDIGRGDHGPSQQGQDNSNGKAGGGQPDDGE